VTTTYYTGDWPTAIQFLFSAPAFGWHAEAGIHVLRLILSGALDRLDETIGWADHLDRTVSEYYREHVWITPSGMYSQNQLKFFLAEVGAERISTPRTSRTSCATTCRNSSSQQISPTMSAMRSLTRTPRS
jgi:hypothetical protein